MLWIALTGGIATGKTTVSQILKNMGFAVIDADKVSHKLMLQGELAYGPIITSFGTEILNNEMEIERKKLGSIVFSDPQKLKELESILHPKIQEYVSGERKKLAEQGMKAAFYDVPLLFEKNLFDRFDNFILVYAGESVQLERLMSRDGLNEKEAQKRIDLQISMEIKKEKSAIIINNNGGDLDLLKKEVERVLKKLGIKE